MNLMYFINMSKASWGSEGGYLINDNSTNIPFYSKSSYTFSAEFRTLFTRDDFNQCIQELSTNFGRSVTYAEWLTTRDEYGRPNGTSSTFILGSVSEVAAKIMSERYEKRYDEMKPKESNMIPFDIKKALAGEKVMTVDGREVDQLHVFTAQQTKTLYGVMGGVVEQWNCLGQYHAGESVHITNLIMAPKKLIGFVNIWRNSKPTHHASKANADCYMPVDDNEKLACIDLSKFEEGHGL